MAVTVSTDQGYRTIVTAGGHTWHADEPIEDGGTDMGPTPTEMSLGALGSCTTITLHMYANRKGWPLEKVDIELSLEKFNAKDYEGYDGDAKFVHEITQKLTFHGDLDEKQIARLEDIATKCPVRRMMEGPTYIHESVTLATPTS